MGKAGKLAAAAAQHGSLSRQTSMAGLAGPLRTIDELVIAHLEYRTQPREIIPPDLLQHLIAKGRNHPPEVLQALQRQAADDETAQRILAGLEELATTIRPPGQVHVPILCYRDGATWVVYSGHRRCLASLLAGRNTVPAIEISPTSSAERELDRIVIETSHEDWTAVELALALRDARDQLRAEWEGKTPAEVGLVQLAVSAEDLAEDFSQPGLTEGSALLGADPQASQFSQPGLTELLTGKRLTGVVNAAIQQRGAMSKGQYHYLLALAERLSPEARALAQQARLTEKHLRPVTRLTDPVQQLACVRAIITYDLTSRDAYALVEAVQAGADPAEEAERLVGASRPAQPGTGPARAARPDPPAVLRRAGRTLWRQCQRTQRDLSWVLDPDHRDARVARLNRDEREALRDQALALREIGATLADLLQ